MHTPYFNQVATHTQTAYLNPILTAIEELYSPNVAQHGVIVIVNDVMGTDRRQPPFLGGKDTPAKN